MYKLTKYKPYSGIINALVSEFFNYRNHLQKQL